MESSTTDLPPTPGALTLLAGSENLKKSESEGDRAKEAKHINSSLTALGKVILALSASPAGASGETSDASHPAGVHVPYRDSKLTRLLKNSLSGNSFTVLMCAVNPAGGAAAAEPVDQIPSFVLDPIPETR